MTHEVDLLYILGQAKDAFATIGLLLIFVVAPAIYILPIDESAWGKKAPAKRRGSAITYCRQHNKMRPECDEEHRP